MRPEVLRVLLHSLGFTEMDCADYVVPHQPVAAVERWLAGVEKVPATVKRQLLSVDAFFDGEISRRMTALCLAAKGGEGMPSCVVMPRFACQRDLEHYAPQFASFGLHGYNAWLRRLRSALSVEQIELRLLDFDAARYETTRSPACGQDSESAQLEWVNTQAAHVRFDD